MLVHISTRFFRGINGTNKLQILHRPGEVRLDKILIIGASAGSKPNLLYDLQNQVVVFRYAGSLKELVFVVVRHGR